MAEDRRDRGAVAGPPRLHFCLSLDPARLQRARERMRAHLLRHGVAPEVIDDAVLATEEAMANAVQHSGSSLGLNVTLLFQGADLVVEVRDHGRGFDPAARDLQAPPGPLQPGGRGLYLIERMMDEVLLSMEGGARVRMRKRGALVQQTPPPDPRQTPLPAALSGLEEAFLATDRALRLVAVNRAAEALAGKPAAELMGTPLGEVLPCGAEHEVDSALREVAESGVPAIIEHMAAPGTIVHEIHVYPAGDGICACVRTFDHAAERATLAGSDRQHLVEELRAQTEELQAQSEELQAQSEEMQAQREELQAQAEEVEEQNTVLRSQGDVLQQQHDELSRRTHFSELLDRINFLIHSSLSIDDVLQRVVVETAKALDVDATVIELREGDQWPVRYAYGMPDDLFGRSLTGEPLVARQVVETGRAVSIPDAEADPLAGALIGRLGARSLTALPLRVRGEILGVLIALDRHRARTADPPEAEFLQNLTAAVSLAWENARLYTAEQEARRLSDATNAFNSAVHGAADPDAVLRRALGEACAALRAGAGTVELHEGRDWVVRYQQGLDHDATGKTLTDAQTPVLSYVRGANGPVAVVDQGDERRHSSGPGAGQVVRMAIPLLAGIDVEGLIFVERSREARFTAAELDYGRKLSAAASLALENARRYEREHSAARLNAALAQVDRAVHSSWKVDEIMASALEEGAAAVAAESAAVTLYEPGQFAIRYVWGWPLEVVGSVISAERERHGMLALRTAAPVAIDDTATDARVERELMDEWGIRSVMALPLIVRDEGVGVLYFNFTSSSHHFTEAEIDFGRKLSGSLSLALQNAWLFEQQQHVATTLQENFVHPLPTVEGLELAAVSEVAHQADLVGGDFHDVLALPNNLVVILMGDVAGKGLRAAGMTETVRSAIRTLSLISPSPEYILRHVNDLLGFEPEHDQFVTALLVMLDLNLGQAFMASAGHPPPVLVSGRRTELVDLPFQPPLGAFELPFKSRRIAMLPGDGLVLYTDGVIEARRGAELFGEERVLQVLRSLDDRSPDAMVHGLLEAVREFADALRDDLQIVAVRLTH